MEVVDLVLPVFAVIVTGWLAGQLGYISRSLADGLVHFAYNVAMPALLFITVAQEPARNLLEWRFLMAFGINYYLVENDADSPRIAVAFEEAERTKRPVVVLVGDEYHGFNR